MDKCPYCNAETRPGDNFCLNCGNRLLPSTPSAQQAQPIGDATLPASADDWSPSNSGETVAGSSPNWSSSEMKTVANTSFEPPTLRAEAPAPAAQATMDKIENPANLVLRSDSGAVLQEYPLDKFEMSIGRAPGSDILLSKDKLTSRRHATIHYENGEYILRDERSANGTFVNGQQLEEMTPHTLKDNDHLGIGEHELVFHAYNSGASGVDIESMPTITVNAAAAAELTYRTREDELLTATNNDDFSTRSMNGGSVPETIEQPENPPAPSPEPPAPIPVAPVAESTPTPEVAQPQTVKAVSGVPAAQSDSRASTGSGGVTFGRLTSLPQPTLPDVAPLVAALATLDGQVSSLQEQLNATQEALRNHESDIAQTTNQLRAGVRNVSERMDNTIADVARSREQLAWTELIQLMEDVMNNPRDIEYVTKLARKARELNKVFQIHQNVLNVLAECTSLLRSLLGDDNR
jgi:pSer/pThr/pTyr-binding forkhead associated (FHA) protein